ncbi:hypothetical protein ACFRNT_21370 [Streptomyces sp. NPDC056697]|uniref:hypothetical protein n=1 Tax=Streptomyces sp. NPDC056697 TaxID=3345915 RepID=UPI0036778606
MTSWSTRVPNDPEVGPRPLRPLFRVTGMSPHPEAAADTWRRIETFFDTRPKHDDQEVES